MVKKLNSSKSIRQKKVAVAVTEVDPNECVTEMSTKEADRINKLEAIKKNEIELDKCTHMTESADIAEVNKFEPTKHVDVNAFDEDYDTKLEIFNTSTVLDKNQPIVHLLDSHNSTVCSLCGMDSSTIEDRPNRWAVGKSKYLEFCKDGLAPCRDARKMDLTTIVRFILHQQKYIQQNVALGTNIDASQQDVIEILKKTMFQEHESIKINSATILKLENLVADQQKLIASSNAKIASLTSDVQSLRKSVNDLAETVRDSGSDGR